MSYSFSEGKSPRLRSFPFNPCSERTVKIGYASKRCWWLTLKRGKQLDLRAFKP